jgi:tRNA pseudouridine55 synthase
VSRRKTGLDLDGMVLVDKPSGMTSNGVVQRAKWLFKANKAGHTGSLDPIATGLLPICLGEATKLSCFMLDSDKRYTVRAKLGRTTTTADTEGGTLEQKPVPALDESLIETVLQSFRGDISQLPPMYSALCHQGQKLYDLARQGIEVERERRNISIYELHLLAFGADYLDLNVHCSKGTYIRSLAEDIGAALGCGGHVETLRRTAVGKLDLAQAVTLEQLQELPSEDRLTWLLPLTAIAEELPIFTLAAEVAFYLRRGQPVFAPNAPTSGLLRLFSHDGVFLGVGEVTDEGMIAPKRLVKDPASVGPRKVNPN